MARVARTLRALRAERGWTQRVLAKKTGLTARYLSRLETQRHDPTLSTLGKLARAFGMTVSDLLA